MSTKPQKEAGGNLVVNHFLKSSGEPAYLNDPDINVIVSVDAKLNDHHVHLVSYRSWQCHFGSLQSIAHPTTKNLSPRTVKGRPDFLGI